MNPKCETQLSYFGAGRYCCLQATGFMEITVKARFSTGVFYWRYLSGKNGLFRYTVALVVVARIGTVQGVEITCQPLQKKGKGSGDYYTHSPHVLLSSRGWRSLKLKYPASKIVIPRIRWCTTCTTIAIGQSYQERATGWNFLACITNISGSRQTSDEHCSLQTETELP
jgi:hypothetical protein